MLTLFQAPLLISTAKTTAYAPASTFIPFYHSVYPPPARPVMEEPPIRILIDVRGSARTRQEAWDEPQKTITKVLEHLGYNRLVSPDNKYDTPNCRFIAVERWDSLVYIVFDLFHIQYNPDNAHLRGNNELPVRVVRQRDKSIKTKEPHAIGRVSEQLRDIHDMHGWEKGPPYKIDHANGAYPVYRSPRSVVCR